MRLSILWRIMEIEEGVIRRDVGHWRAIRCIWNFQQFGINAKRKEKTRIRFNSDVFAAVAVAVVDAKAP